MDRKAPTPVYEPYFKALVIPDLQDAERSGAFDREVLLFLQDGYVQRTLVDSESDLGEVFVQINDEVEDQDARATAKKEAVIRAVLEFYARLKAEGDETTGVRGYAGAAGVYLNGAIVDYQTYLLDLAQHLEQSVRVGSTPDLGWLAGHTYALLARAAKTAGTIESSLGVEAGLHADRILGKGMSAIGAPGQDSVALALGTKLWRMVQAIDKAPLEHVVNVEGDQEVGQALVESDPWDFEPANRQEFEP